MVIGIDIDEVALNYIDPFLDFVNKKDQTHFKRGDVIDYSFEDCGILPPGTNNIYVEEFGKAGLLRTLPLIENAKYHLDLLQKEDHTLIYFTSRDPMFAEDTAYCMKWHGVYHPILYSNKTINKGALTHAARANVLIDDSPIFVKETAEHVSDTRAILFSNVPGSIRACEGVVDIARSWAEVYRAIHK